MCENVNREAVPPTPPHEMDPTTFTSQMMVHQRGHGYMWPIVVFVPTVATTYYSLRTSVFSGASIGPCTIWA